MLVKRADFPCQRVVHDAGAIKNLFAITFDCCAEAGNFIQPAYLLLYSVYGLLNSLEIGLLLLVLIGSPGR